ncbi:MAG: hypothetical protein H6867_04880 [Rhodospirillales bacterium]|nr:hypothetical protein [Rhodospirillales bacterium]MCB9994835.1 hypothetical protein [Rhodospirillales bacterium]
MKTLKQKKHRQNVCIDELVIWTYEKQKADLIVERGIGLYPVEKDADGIFYKLISGDGTYQIHRNHELGIKLEGGGFDTAEIHPDAETVHELIKTKTFTHLERGLLIDFGKTGIMPDWLPGAKPEIRPARKKNGKLKMIYPYKKNHEPIACEIEIVMSQEHIAFRRGIYSRWWAALDKLCRELWKNDVVMTSFNVLPPMAVEEPWLWDKKKLTIDKRENL